MEKKQFISASATAAQVAVANSFNDDPFSIELEHLDVFDIVDNSKFMDDVIATKKSLFEEAILMRKMMRLDELTIEEEKSESGLKKQTKTPKAKKTRRRNIDDEDVDEVEGEGANNDATEAGKGDEEDSDEEEIVEEDVEEVIEGFPIDYKIKLIIAKLYLHSG